MRKALIAVAVLFVVLIALVVPGGAPGHKVIGGFRNMECFERTKDGRGAGPTGTVALGDSNTQGRGAQIGYGFQSKSSWFSYATCNGPWRYVHNSGVYGNTTGQMLARVYSDAADYHPARCVVLGGTNDNDDTAASMSNLRRIVGVLRQAGIRPVLGTIPPRADSRAAFPPVYNAALRRLATELNVPVIDFYSALTDGQGQRKNELFRDALHVNPQGAKVMAARAERDLP